MNHSVTRLVITILLSGLSLNLFSQLLLGSSDNEINFREEPGLNSRVLSTVSSSNLLVLLPGEPKDGFIQVFDIETSSFGYVYQPLIRITDTLSFQKQHFFERSDTLSSEDVQIELINRTNRALFVWINRNSYSLDAFEKKELIFDDENIIYFSSSPGLFPVFGRETLKKGYKYRWDFHLRD